MFRKIRLEQKSMQANFDVEVKNGAKRSPCMLALGWPSADFSDFLPDLKSRTLTLENSAPRAQRMK